MYEQPLNERLRAIEIPIQLIYGKQDVRTPVEANALPVLERVCTPDAQKRLAILDNAGHFILQNQPIPTAEAVIEFVEAMR